MGTGPPHYVEVILRALDLLVASVAAFGQGNSAVHCGHITSGFLRVLCVLCGESCLELGMKLVSVALLGAARNPQRRF